MNILATAVLIGYATGPRSVGKGSAFQPWTENNKYTPHNINIVSLFLIFILLVSHVYILHPDRDNSCLFVLYP